MTLRRRLDAELVRRGLADSRTEAQRLIEVGSVVVGGRASAKPATMVAGDESITVATEVRWASRAGEKLEAALDRFGVQVAERQALDVGASTGGFTDVLLARGARSVVAVDVGYGQMISRLSTDRRVRVVDRTNFRTVDLATLGGPFGVVTMDVSFISASSLALQLHAVGAPGTDYVVLVKPQFEVGRDQVGRGGIIRDPALHAGAVRSVIQALTAAGIGPRGSMPSPVLGSKGNREFLVVATHSATPVDEDLLIEAALS
jgi:23S rRNA (cytidine1920-2'-O)/16S rRNA (cytidine1409-2'-O)-methyltransferase